MEALALRGRSSTPRSVLPCEADSSIIASNSTRSASLGRYVTRKHSPTKDMFHIAHQRCERTRSSSCDDDGERRRGSILGGLSVVLLLFVTFSNVSNETLSQGQRFDSHADLDMDLIRPAFLYKASVDRPNIGLGSAAISKITQSLSPILPFTGGVDLRRSEHYSAGNLLDNLSSLLKDTLDAFANAKQNDLDVKDQAVMKSQTSSKETKRKDASKKQKETKRTHHAPLGASQPFVPLSIIADLTLEDVAKVFEYAIKVTQDGFNAGKFANSQLSRVRTVLEGMDEAVSKSRGRSVKPIMTAPGDLQPGNADVFNFCAAMRVFAEWRVIRQVPEGYKGYAVGMSLGHKDVVQNVQKIENAAHAYIDNQINMGFTEAEIISPTLRDVLLFEIESGDHPTLPRLKETSGAMGLLWVRRQLSYQTAIFENILAVPGTYATTKDAVSAAYNQVYNKYHGWAVQKIFNYSFQASPDAEVIFKFMNPHHLKKAKEMARRVKPKNVGEKVSVEETSDLVDDGLTSIEETPPDKFLHRIGWEFDKFVNGIGKALEQKMNGKKLKVRGGGAHVPGEGLSGSELEEFIAAEMSQNVYEDIQTYLKVVKPLLADIASLFEELNMDDPTKV